MNDIKAIGGKEIGWNNGSNCNKLGDQSISSLQIPLLPQPNIYVNNKIAAKLKNTLNFSLLNNSIRYGGQIGFTKPMPLKSCGTLKHSWNICNSPSSSLKSLNTAVVL